MLSRSIQKLEELNVGMENMGEEVKSLAQQCNGDGSTPPPEDNNNPQSGTPEPTRTQGGGVLSSTPQRAVGGRAVPPPEESPVVNQRYCGSRFTGVSAGKSVKIIVFFVFFSGQNLKGGGQSDSPGSLSRDKEVSSYTISKNTYRAVVLDLLHAKLCQK